MTSFAVVTDSTADIPEEFAAERDIDVVPLNVTFGSETFTDGDLTQEQFFERMRSSSTLPTTSQPPVGAFVEAFERALEKAETVLSVNISSQLSGTVESARQAAEQFPGRVHVFDSLNLSWGLAYQALEAAKAASDGVDIPTAIERVEGVRDRVKMIVGLDSLENLQKGGRIGAVSAFLGSLLDLKVTLTVAPDGTFLPVGRSRGEKAALRHTIDWVATQMGDATRGHFAVGHALSEERALRLRETIESRWEAASMIVYRTGSVISAHTGTGWGVAVLPVE